MGYKQYCKDYENIENYEKAKKDNFKGWHCHHRLETHTPDGERRLVDIPKKELIALGMYYHRPAEELIFLTSREHNAFRRGRHHTEEAKKKMMEAHKGKPVSEETKKKLREAKKGENNPFYGKKHTEESKKMMAEAKKGNTWTKGRLWFNNGEINKRCFDCPPGFVPGRIKKP